MTGVPDPAGSRAVLIGSAGYRDLPGLPAVEANIEDLAAELADATVLGTARAAPDARAQPSYPSDLLDPVHQAGEEATDTLLVYFAGHGMRDADSADLFLALYGSRENVGYTAVAYQHLREAVRASRAARKVVVLDCCFSGRAARILTAGDGVAAETAVEGAYLLSASPGDRVALAPDGERHTAFSGELIKVLREGIPDGPEVIDLDTLFRTLEFRLRSKNRPLPQHAQENGVGRLKIVRNRARAPRGVPAGPVLRGDLQTAMVGTGLALARTLRSAGRTRDALPVLRLALRERSGAGEGDLLAVQFELADMLAETGQLGEAIAVLEEAFVRVHRFYRPEAVLVCRRLAGLLQESGNHLHACEVLDHALDLIQDDTRNRP